MAPVGIRELRQRASELVRRVERGETIQVTDRGRPVAILSPAPRTPWTLLGSTFGLLERVGGLLK